jgi:hypothetical protein
MSINQRRTKVTHSAKIVVLSAAAYDGIVDDLNMLGASICFDAAMTADLPNKSSST